MLVNESERLLLKKTFEKQIPLSSMVELTNACNVDCIMCYQYKDTPNELSVTETIRVLDDLADMGCLYLDFTGGEALMKPGFWDILDHAQSRHFAINLLSNGTTLTPTIVKRLSTYNIMSLQLSFEGSCAATHDYIFQKKGSFDRMVQCLEAIRDNRMRAYVKTTVMKPNWREIPEIDRIVTAFGGQYSWSLQLTERNTGDTTPQQLRLSDHELECFRALMVNHDPEYAFSDKGKGKQSCGAGRTGLTVSALGDVYACTNLPVPVGNIREKSLKEIWQNSSFLEQVRSVNENTLEQCGNCAVSSSCSRCMAEVYKETGSLFGCDSETLRQAKFWDQTLNS